MRPRPSHAGQSSRNLLTAWIGNTLSPIFSETGKRCQEITDKNKTKTRFSVYMLWSPQNLWKQSQRPENRAAVEGTVRKKVLRPV